MNSTKKPHQHPDIWQVTNQFLSCWIVNELSNDISNTYSINDKWEMIFFSSSFFTQTQYLVSTRMLEFMYTVFSDIEFISTSITVLRKLGRTNVRSVCSGGGVLKLKYCIYEQYACMLIKGIWRRNKNTTSRLVSIC